MRHLLLLGYVLTGALALPSALLGDDNPAEPDFTVVNLPTTLRLPRHKAAFRVTHRFARPLGSGDLGDLAADFFGLDGGAQIGIQLRFGLFSGTQIGLYRTSDRTIEVFLQQDVIRQGRSPFGLAAFAALEGLDNLQEEYTPLVGLVLSRKLGRRAAVYAVPVWLRNTNPLASAPADDDSTFLVGLGGRVQVTEKLAIVGEFSPRAAGFKGSRGGRSTAAHATFGIENRVGGHVFQINVSNDLGTTPAQVARGRQGPDDWFLGFNISRKFY
jgi:hypothetical protein